MHYLRYRRSGVLILIVLLALSGCYSSSQITSFTELERASQEEDPINALTTDSTLYTFDTYSLTDSTLSGKGSLKRDGTSESFEGTLAFSEIIFIERLESRNGKAFWIIPMSLAIIGGISALLQPPEFNIRRPSSGSCPFVYSFDGSKFILEAEPFSTSISHALETETYHLLPSLVPANNELKVRVKNERPETHLFDSVHLFVVDAKKSSSVVLDTNNRVWNVQNAMPPVKAYDHSGRNILNAVTDKDGRDWKSDMENISPGSDFRDKLEVQFEIPPGKTEATLIVDAINSDLITEIYRSIGAILGDETLRFYRALEEDPALKGMLRKAVRKTSLLIEVAEGEGWKEVGILPPEAAEVSFSRAIRLGNLDAYESPLTVRFSSMTDVWHVDALSIDYSEAKSLPMHPLEITSVNATFDGEDPERAISKSDSLYAMMFPPEYMDITFDPSPADTMQTPLYVFSARGFMYEWFPNTDDPGASVLPDGFAGVDRIELLKYLNEREGLFLPPIYARWKENRKR